MSSLLLHLAFLLFFTPQGPQQVMVSQKISSGGGGLSLVNSSEGHAGNVSATTIASAALSTTSGNLIVAAIGLNSISITVSSVTDTAGNTYTQCAGAYNNAISSAGTVDIWYAKNITGNANNVVTVTFSSTVNYRSINQVQITGASTSAPFETAAIGSTTAGTSVTSASFSPASSGNFNVGYSSASGLVGAWTAGTNYTSLTSTTAPDRFSEYRAAAPSGAQTASASENVSLNLEFTVASFK